MPRAAIAQEASATPPDVSLVATAPISAASLGDLMSGRDIPLSLRLSDLNPSWRQFSVGGGLDLTVYAPYGAALGAANPTTFFTRGQTVGVGSESFLVAYRVLLSLPLLQKQTEALSNRNAEDESEVASLKLPPDTTLSLSLMNVRQLGSMNDIRPFDAAAVVSSRVASAPPAEQDDTASLNNLKQIGLALSQYTQDYDDHFPPMQSVASMRQIQAEAQAGTTTHVQVVLLPYAKNAAVFAHPRTKEIYRPNPILSRKPTAHIVNPASFVAFYEASPEPDGKRAVLYVDGHVQRIEEMQWPALKQASKIGIVAQAATIERQVTLVVDNSRSVVQLSGAAALYYLYKQHGTQPPQSGVQGRYFMSMNGRLYFREAKTAQAKWLSPPTEPIIILDDEAAPYKDYQGFNGSKTGKTFGGYGAGATFKDAVPAQPLLGY